MLSPLSEEPFKILCGLFFGLAIMASISRIAITCHLRQPLQVHDWLFFAAIALLITATVLLFKIIGPFLHIQSWVLPNEPMPDFPPQERKKFGFTAWSYLVIAWAVIFLIKFSFLWFFRSLVNRLKSFIIYWRVVVGVNVVVFIFCAFNNFIICRKSNPDSADCNADTVRIETLAFTAISVGLDIITDLMIVAIPLMLVWKIQIKPRQKIGLGIFLCLNVSMAAVACVRGAGIRSDPKWDTPWTIFWLQMEACIAVSMASLTAFRSLFFAGANGSEARKAKSWYSPAYEKIMSRKNKSKENRESGEAQLPDIPTATLKGMRTFIQGGRKPTIMDLRDDIERHSMEAERHGHENQITVIRELSVGSSEALQHEKRSPQSLV